MAGARRKARIIALQALFEVDSVGHVPQRTLEHLIDQSGLAEEAAEFAWHLVEAVLENKERIDVMIQDHAPAWPLAQMALIDRNILRIAICEILVEDNVPVKAAINEAVELAKMFGSDTSSKFVNGVLGSISAKV